MAGAVFAILALVSSVLVLAGVLATPLLIDVIAFGFHRRKARADYLSGAHSVPWRRTVGAFGLVSGHSQ